MPQKPAQSISPTLELYGALDRAFIHFNETIFGGTLPPCLITLRSSNRIRGYHHNGRFISATGIVGDELGLHPGYFAVLPIEIALSTLVHEMVHHWQEHFGRPSKSNPHNRDWVTKMVSVGLVPSHTGLPGGRQTGRSMSHYIQPNGLYAAACQDLLKSGFELPWVDRYTSSSMETFANQREALASAGVALNLSPPLAEALMELPDPDPVLFEPPLTREKTRFMFHCKTCEMRAWAGNDVHLVCGECNTDLERKE